MDVPCPFFTVRDGPLHQARKVLRNLDIGALHDDLKQRILFFAATLKHPGSLELTRKAVERGVKLDYALGQTPWFYAAASGNQNVVRFLIMLGFSPNYRDNKKRTAMTYAVLRNHLETVRLLARLGCSLESAAQERLLLSLTTSQIMKDEIRRLGVEQRERTRKSRAACANEQLRNQVALLDNFSLQLVL